MKKEKKNNEKSSFDFGDIIELLSDILDLIFDVVDIFN